MRIVFWLTICIIIFLVSIWYISTDTAQIAQNNRHSALEAIPIGCPVKTIHGQQTDFIRSLTYSLEYLQEHLEDVFQFGSSSFTGHQLHNAYQTLLVRASASTGLSTSTFITYLCTHFNFFRPPENYVRFTGYFEPVLDGSLTRDESNIYPLYRMPDQGSNKSMQYTRSQIDFEGALAGNGLEIAWVSDLIDLFFLHIQGSGKIALADGSLIRVGFAGHNGHTYKAIGNLLLKEGQLTKSDMSMQSIKAYLRAHPKALQRILGYNPRYIFFEILDSPDGPIGSLGKPLTPYHSIATDRTLFPPGALAFISLQLPRSSGEQQQQSLLVLNQDTGAAITSAARADLFLGSGSESEFIAGHLHAPGELYFLAPAK